MSNLRFHSDQIKVLSMALRIYGFEDLTVTDALAVRDIMELVIEKGDDITIKDITKIGSSKRDKDNQ